MVQLRRPGKGEFSPGDMGLYSPGRTEKLPKNEAKNGLWSEDVVRKMDESPEMPLTASWRGVGPSGYSPTST